MPIRLIEEDGGVRFGVKVVPGASRDRIVGPLGDALKIAVSKPPQGGAANAAVLALLASALEVPASAVQIVRGHGNPRKEIRISGLTSNQLAQKLGQLDQSRS